MLFSFFSEDYYFRQREIWQAADFTPSKIIDLNCCPLAFIGNCSTFVVACANEPSNVERWEHRTINKVPKRGKYPLPPLFECQEIIKRLNLHLLECTPKGYAHISDL